MTKAVNGAINVDDATTTNTISPGPQEAENETPEFQLNPFAAEPESLLPPAWDASQVGELAVFLKWAHTRLPVCNSNFVSELTQLTGKIAGLKATPAELADNLGTVVYLDLLIQWASEERARLGRVYQEFEAKKAEMMERYTEQDVLAVDPSLASDSR